MCKNISSRREKSLSRPTISVVRMSISGLFSSFRPLFFVVLALISFSGCNERSDNKASTDTTDQAEISLSDAIGDTVRLKGPGQRLVSMAPNLTEVVYALGAGDMLVGRSAYCDYPPKARSVPVVGDMQSINYERIVQLAPDLVLMSIAGNNDGGYKKLKELGLRPFALAATTVDGVVNAIDTVGMLIGREKQAATLTEELRRGIDSIRRLAKSAPRVRTFIVINRAPLMTVSQGFLSELLEAAGGENIAAGGAIVYPTYSREELLRQDPEVILVPGPATEGIAALIESYPEWKTLRAVRSGRVYTVDPDILLRPGPRLLQGCKLLYQLLHAPTAQPN